MFPVSSELWPVCEHDTCDDAKRALFSVINIMIIYDFHKNAEIYDISYVFRSIVCFLFSSFVAELSSSHFSALRRSFLLSFFAHTHTLSFLLVYLFAQFSSLLTLFFFPVGQTSLRPDTSPLMLCESENHVKMKKNREEKSWLSRFMISEWKKSRRRRERTTEMKTFFTHFFLSILIFSGKWALVFPWAAFTCKVNSLMCNQIFKELRTHLEQVTQFWRRWIPQILL